jgi:hypothetical protein
MCGPEASSLFATMKTDRSGRVQRKNRRDPDVPGSQRRPKRAKPLMEIKETECKYWIAH